MVLPIMIVMPWQKRRKEMVVVAGRNASWKDGPDDDGGGRGSQHPPRIPPRLYRFESYPRKTSYYFSGGDVYLFVGCDWYIIHVVIYECGMIYILWRTSAMSFAALAAMKNECDVTTPQRLVSGVLSPARPHWDESDIVYI